MRQAIAWAEDVIGINQDNYERDNPAVFAGKSEPLQGEYQF